MVRTAMIATLVLIAAYICIRNYGLYPIVFSDELSYSKFARRVPFSDASLPNYIYYIFYRATNLCGNYYLDCSRAMNLVFYSLALPFIYRIGSLTSSKNLALFVGVAAIAGASNTYTAYFMPEAMYFLAFWIISWLAIRINAGHGLRDWGVLGLSVGFASLIKPHALFLLPGLGMYAWLLISGFSLLNAKRAMVAVVTVFASAIASKAVLGFVIAGYSGLTLFGTFYAPYARSASLVGLDHYTTMLRYSAFSFAGHMLSLALIYALPMAVLIARIIDIAKRRTAPAGSEEKLSIYALIIIISLVTVTALFTASISSTTPGNHLHIRYYFFALPLLLLVLIARDYKETSSPAQRVAIALPIAGMLIYAFLTRLSTYEVYSSTAPELYGLEASGSCFNLLGALAFAALAVWAFLPKQGIKLYLFIYLPIMITSSLVMVSADISKRAVKDTYDMAGLDARNKLDQKSRDETIVVGDQAAVGGLFRTLFYLDTQDLYYLQINAASSSIHGIAPNADFNLRDIANGKHYLIVIGNHKVVGDTTDISCNDSYCIKKINN